MRTFANEIATVQIDEMFLTVVALVRKYVRAVCVCAGS